MIIEADNTRATVMTTEGYIMADFTLRRRRPLASRNEAMRVVVSASRPPLSPAFNMLMYNSSKISGY